MWPAELHPEHTVDPYPLHGFEIFGNSLLADIAVDPETEDPGFGRVRRIAEELFKVLGAGMEKHQCTH